jgi:hypothetical protein
MKGADLTAFTGSIPTNGNGTHRPGKKNGAPSKRAAALAASATAAPLEPFAAIEAEPVDASMWPVHQTVWFQPDLAPVIPAWSGLAIERRHTLPSPDFLPIETGPVNRANALDRSTEVVGADPSPEPPLSELELLGWDPRMVSGKEHSK